GDRVGLAQELQELDAPLLQPLDAKLRQRRVLELLLDLEQEFLDSRRRRHRLLALQDRERALVFLIGEVQADAARDDQRAADERQDEQEILAKQPPAPQPRDVGMRSQEPLRQQCHSITRSARARSEAGSLMPSVRAAARSTTKSYLSGCSIGMSAGFAPLRMRSTWAAARRGLLERLGP